jgi:hypothetical protein
MLLFCTLLQMAATNIVLAWIYSRTFERWSKTRCTLNPGYAGVEVPMDLHQHRGRKPSRISQGAEALMDPTVP